MENNLARVPEPAIMTHDEELEYVKNNSFIFSDGHPLIKNFSDRCPSFPNGQCVRVLDIGCGGANMAAQIAMAFPEAYVVAVDASATMLRYAKMLVEHFKLSNRISVRCAWLPDADFGEPDKSFDFVFARSVLHHFVDPMDFWRTIKRYAKEDSAVFTIDLLRPLTMVKLNKFVCGRFGTNVNPIVGAFRSSLLASHTIEEIRIQLTNAGLDDIILDPDETHAVAWRAGRFGKEIS